MRPALVVEIDVTSDAAPRFGDAVIRVQVDCLVLDRLPESLDEYVVTPASFAIHADRDPVSLQQIREITARELAPLIGIEDLGTPVLGQGLLHGL